MCTLIKKTNTKGIVLPLILLIILVMIPVGLALSSLVKTDSLTTLATKSNVKAIQVADAGIKRAIAEIVNDAAYSGTGSVQTMATGGYNVSVFLPGSTFEGAILPPRRYAIEALGYVPNSVNPIETKKVITVIDRVTFSPFDAAVIAGAGGVSFSGSAKINGPVSTSKDYTDAELAALNVFLIPPTINTINDDVEMIDDFTAPEVPVGATDLGVLSLKGDNNYDLYPGTYTVTSINIGGNAKVTLNTISGGPGVYLYCSGNIDAKGKGFVNTGQDASTFFIFGTGTSGSITMEGTADLYCAIYAPTYVAKMVGTAYADGAVNCYQFSATGTSDMVYDPSLSGMPGGVIRMNMFSWREDKI